MFSKLWRRFRDGSAQRERQRDEAAVEQAQRDHEQQRDARMSEADQLPPPFKNQDWPVGGP